MLSKFIKSVTFLWYSLKMAILHIFNVFIPIIIWFSQHYSSMSASLYRGVVWRVSTFRWPTRSIQTSGDPPAESHTLYPIIPVSRAHSQRTKGWGRSMWYGDMVMGMAIRIGIQAPAISSFNWVTLGKYLITLSPSILLHKTLFSRGWYFFPRVVIKTALDNFYLVLEIVPSTW